MGHSRHIGQTAPPPAGAATNDGRGDPLARVGAALAVYRAQAAQASVAHAAGSGATDGAWDQAMAAAGIVLADAVQAALGAVPGSLRHRRDWWPCEACGGADWTFDWGAGDYRCDGCARPWPGRAGEVAS